MYTVTIQTNKYHSHQTLQQHYKHMCMSKSAASITLTQMLDRMLSKQPTVAAVFQFRSAVTSWFPLASVKILPVLAHTAECVENTKNSHILKLYPSFTLLAGSEPFAKLLLDKNLQKAHS